jgi:hypothetical protein
MIKKFPARINESNLKGIYVLLSELKRNLKVDEANKPCYRLISSSLELALHKASIASNRLGTKSSIDI